MLSKDAVKVTGNFGPLVEGTKGTVSLSRTDNHARLTLKSHSWESGDQLDLETRDEYIL